MPLRVLIVEDNAAERKILRALFNHHPQFKEYAVQISEAKDGQEGIAAAKRDHCLW